MASIRTRLTFAYGATMIVTMVAFGVALSVARRSYGYQELGQVAIIQADHILAVLREAKVARNDSLTVMAVDPTLLEPRPVVRPTSYLRDVLDPLGGQFLLLDWEDRILFRSRAMRVLPDSSQALVARVASTLQAGARAAIVELPHDSATHGRLLLVARRDSVVGPHIARVVVGVASDIAELPASVLLGAGLMLAPLIILLAVSAAHLVSRGTFQPVDEVIAELGAITDGRSLHRRLPVDQSDEELARLASTLNAMIARLETSFSGLRRFTADASHELKTPLTVLRANVDRAMSPRTSVGERMIALEESMQEVARMTDLVDSLLTLARADEGRFDLHREPLQLDAIVRDVYETAQILGEDQGLEVGLLVLEDAVVQGDAVRLRQLFLNLVTNAIKYTPRGGRVDLSLRRTSSSEIVFAVRDTGVGISAADLTHIFDRFWRADRARSRASERGGFGLGLSIAQWIAHAHGGTLTASSRLGRGSVFTVSLPAVPQAVVEESVSMKRA
jgi:two-component system, OmpR family, sensor kinase